MRDCIQACLDQAGVSSIGEIVAALVIALLPTIITGLTNYPKAQSVLDRIRAILDLVSLVSHKDSEGTFKAPGKRSKPKSPPKPPPTPAA